jgi:hypothetical protein
LDVAVFGGVVDGGLLVQVECTNQATVKVKLPDKRDGSSSE